MSCSLSLNGICYSTSNKNILNEISLKLGHQEKIAIVGENGSGKSTLLKIIAGLIKPSCGEIELFHNKINSLKDFKNYRREIGYLPQDVTNHFLCPTVIEDVAFSLRANGINEEISVQKAKDILKELQIENLENRSIFELSGGEQKIVALAGLLIVEPKILLLDEPTNHLDVKSQKIVVNILNNIDKSMIIVSHQEEFVNSLVSIKYRLEDATIRKN